MGKYDDFMNKNHDDLMITIFMGLNLVLIQFGIMILKGMNEIDKLSYPLWIKLPIILILAFFGFFFVLIILFFQVKLSKKGFIKKMFKYELKW